VNLSKRSKDALWTTDGDLYLDPNGKGEVYIATAKQDEILHSSVIKRLTSSQGDWRTVYDLGADLRDFMGLPNSRETSDFIKSRVLSTLTQDGLIRSGAIDIELFPISLREVFGMMYIDSLNGEGPQSLGFSFDLRDNKMIPRLVNV